MKYKAFVIFLFLLTGCVGPPEAHALGIGEKAPAFVLKNVSDAEVALEQFKGKVIFVNFWASWCRPCKKELPLLNRLQARNKAVVVLAVNIDKKRTNVDDFLRKHPVDIPVLLDPGGKVVASFGARAMPTSFILDGEGVVRRIHFGFDEKNDPMLWEKEINELSGGAE